MDKGARTKQRLDVLLVERGLTETREQARRLILAGKVTVAGTDNPKPGQQFSTDIAIQLTAQEKYVSRGGLKLEYALQNFKVSVFGQVCVDIGASTGGFTDCFLQHGAALVYAVDVGASQMHARVRNDERVVVIEHTNARQLSPNIFSRAPSIAAIDVSFISLTKILPALANSLSGGATCIALVKPQFEATRVEVSRGKGIIRDPAVHHRILTDMVARMPQYGWQPLALTNSPIQGGSGNREFLVHLVCAQSGAVLPPSSSHIDIDAVLEQASKAV